MAIPVTFVLPSNGCSGGVRVTVEMARRLLGLGYDVRVAYRVAPRLSLAQLKGRARAAALRLAGFRERDWTRGFPGRVERFLRLEQLDFAPGEVVIAVGTMTIDELHVLRRDVLKVKYCHGFASHQPEVDQRVWSLPLPVICVSRTLVPRLEELSGHPVAAVVPNGVSSEDYFIEDRPARPRDGVGTIYGDHYLKNPQLTLALLAHLRERWPGVPHYVFGEPACPDGLPRASYWRYPPVGVARELYNRSKIWLLASRSEGLPGPVLEAMACGCVVVSTATLGARELIRDGQNGVLVPTGDLEGFLEPIGRLLADEPLRRRLAEAGRRTAEEFSWENAVRKMDAFLQALVRGELAVASEPRRMVV